MPTKKSDIEVEADSIVQSSGIQTQLNDVKNELTEFVKKNPLTSVAIAAGVGFLLARLLSGRKN